MKHGIHSQDGAFARLSVVKRASDHLVGTGDVAPIREAPNTPTSFVEDGEEALTHEARTSG
jgi:hypothetical protein